MGGIFTANGAKFSIGPSVSAEPADAAAYAALSYTEVAFAESLGEYGDEASIVTFAEIGAGRVRKAKGARDAGTMPVTTAHIADDAGQDALIAAEATNNKYAFKVVLPNRLTVGGTDEINYFIGLVTSKRDSVGTNDNVVRRTFNIAIDSEVTVVDAT